MLIDTGAQISLINNNIIEDQSLINKKNKITISSIHGSENTLGDISTKILKNNISIPIQLQVTKNQVLKEDGILGYDILGDKAIINGPQKTLIINSGNSLIEFPIKTKTNRINLNSINDTENEIQAFHKINYLTEEDIDPQYEFNLQRVKTITQEISEVKIKIKPLKS